MKKRKIKKIGWIIFLLVFFIPPLYLDVKLGISLIYEKYFDRSYIKIDQYNTITVWRNYIIFGEYHHIYHPKSNYIFVKDYIEHYDFKCSITQDSILAIWSTAKIEVYGLVEFKAIEINSNIEPTTFVQLEHGLSYYNYGIHSEIVPSQEGEETRYYYS